MDQEAQGKASHSCMPSKAAVCLDLVGSVEWTAFSTGMVSTIQRAALVTPAPQQQPGLALSLLPGTCLPQTLFPALKAES